MTSVFKKLIPGLQLRAQLREVGVLGMNRRNYSYIAKYNDRSNFPLVDNKLTTKRLALEHDVQTPNLIGVIESQHAIGELSSLLKDDQGFCIKPAKGSGGKGILVIIARDGEKFKKANGQTLSIEDIKRHCSNILAGLFSLGGAVDVAMIESLINPNPALNQYSHEGVPDIRVIVFQGIPVMAMIRLACRASQGKANLHQGAIGVGLNLANGHAVTAVQNDQLVEFHPDTKAKLSDLRIDDWESLLRLACKCHDMCRLGYMGVDLVSDAVHGPSLLELNARPGLSIQIANSAGLLPRLRKVESIKSPNRLSIEEKIAFARESFGSNP